MRINPISYNYRYTAFKQKNDDFFDELLNGYMNEKPKNQESIDDFSTADCDNYVREILSGYKYRETSLGYKKSPENNDLIEQWEFNRRSANPGLVRELGKGAYRGESILYAPYRIPIFKRKGVIRIIDLANMRGLNNLCESNDIEYYHPDFLDDYYDNPAFLTKEKYRHILEIRDRYGMNVADKDYDTEVRKFIDSFKEFTKILNEGHFYISCDHGDLRTGFALQLNEAFNPLWDGVKYNKFTDKAMFRTFYEKLTPQDKDDLGFTPDFENELREKLGIKEGGD